MVLLGAHESVAGGLHLAFSRIEQVQGEVLQIFTRNQRQWQPALLKSLEIDLFREAHDRGGKIPVASHASYLVNLATSKSELRQKSINNLILELQRCELLGVPWVVLHPGSHGGDGVEAGLDRFIANLDQVFTESDTEVQILIETTAGQGTGLGSTFEELAYILGSSQYPQLLGACVDTCHVFSAGYELRTGAGYEATFAALDRTVGIERVRFLHLNDSKKELGSRVDRHEHIGHGLIGVEGFRNLLNDKRLSGVPMVIETPKSENLEEDQRNLQALRSLISASDGVMV